MIFGLALVGVAAEVLVAAGPRVQGRETAAVSEAHPWARVVRDQLSKSLFEQMYGAEAEAKRLQYPTRRLGGGLVEGRDSWSKDLLTSVGADPLPAYNYDPGVGILYVEMEGVTLTPSCPTTDFANGALNCTPLVAHEVDVPPMSGSDAAKAAAFQQLRQYYDAFNVVMSTERPPDYLPYTMAVIGGSAELVGQDPSCGIANVACDGLKRNHVSLTFPGCGDPAGVAAQETAHNWGLEHTDNNGDLMMQGVFGVQAFLDTCMNILNSPDSDTQCGYVHEVHCAAGEGEQQNSFAELMGVFGPRIPDTTPPEIVEIYPEDGSVFTTEDQFVIGAVVEEDGTMVGVKWTWLEGLPPDTESFTRCTNNVCDEEYSPGPSYDVSGVSWEFVALQQPPVGTYSFRFEVMDAYGLQDSRTITIEVVDEGDTGPQADASSGGAGDEAGSGTGGGTGLAEGPADADAGDDAGDDEDEDEETSTGEAPADGPAGCGCRLPASPTPLRLGAFVLLAAFVRRRRSRRWPASWRTRAPAPRRPSARSARCRRRSGCRASARWSPCG